MASSSCATTPSSILTGRKRVIGELSRGRDIADQLRRILRESGVNGAVSAQDLVAKILDTFTQSLSMLSGGDPDEVSQVPAVVMKSEDSGHSYKTPASKDRRGCYKRKKTSNPLVRDTPTSFDDGHAWRKYGQKAILKAKYPRNYFRCTHKFDQGCQAQKQVQQIQDDPPLVRTTYHGEHTCKNLHKSAHQIIMDATTEEDSSVIWSFQSQEPAGLKPENGFPFDNLTEEKGAIKQENEECYISPDLTVQFDASQGHHFGAGAFSSGSDPGDVISSDVYSCTASTHDSMDMDMMVDHVNFEDFLGEFESFS